MDRSRHSSGSLDSIWIVVFMDARGLINVHNSGRSLDGSLDVFAVRLSRSRSSLHSPHGRSRFTLVFSH